MFYGNLELPELDKIQTIKELLHVKSGLNISHCLMFLRLILC